MASDKGLPVVIHCKLTYKIWGGTPDFHSLQPTQGGLVVFTTSDAEIKSEISATHVPAEKDFDANSIFVVVKQILKPFDVMPLQDRSQDRKVPEILEEEALTDNLDPILSTDEQLSLEKNVNTQQILKLFMADQGSVGTSKFCFGLQEIYILATTQHDPLTQLIESVKIPEYLSGYLKEEIKRMTSEMLTATECIFELEKQKSMSTNNAKDVSMLSNAMDNVPLLVYGIIMTAIAFLTLTCCLTSNGDTTQELFSLAKSIFHKLYKELGNITHCLKDIEKRKAIRSAKEFFQTTDEVTEVVQALIFGKDDVQPLIDSCLDEPVSLNVLKNKGVLLFFSDLHVSRDDILVMKPIYEEITDYNIVRIPIVAQWTDELWKKFDILRSQMPWYVLQYFSQLAGNKFIKEEWHFENGPVVVAMDARGNIQRKNLFPGIRTHDTGAFPLTGLFRHRPWGAALQLAAPGGPHAMQDLTFHCGGKDSRWIKQFSEKVNAIAEDPIIKKERISVECSCVENVNTWNPFQKARKRNEEIQRILPSFKNEKRWAVLIKWSTKIVSDDGPTILKVLEMFEEWKQYVPERGFENCFREYHEKLRSTSPNTSTSQPV